MTYNPLLSVVIPTYHRNDLLAKCLDRLDPNVQTLATDQYEVIVSDDGHESTAEDMIRQNYPWVKWVAGPRKGPAANRNNGAKQSIGEWIAFTDDDCLPDPQWLEAYAEAIVEHPEYLVFEGRVYADRPQRSLAEKCPGNDTGGYLWSCNFAINKPLFTSINGFDDRFPYAAMEDVDLRFRLTESNIDFLFLKSASVCHPWRLSGGWQEFKRHQKSTLIYLLIHPNERSRINSIYYLRLTLALLVRNTLPGLFRFRGKGIVIIFLEHLAFTQMIFILLLHNYSNHYTDLILSDEKN